MAILFEHLLDPIYVWFLYNEGPPNIGRRSIRKISNTSWLQRLGFIFVAGVDVLFAWHIVNKAFYEGSAP